MKKSHILILTLLMFPCFLIMLNDNGINDQIEDNLVFKQKLSDYALYKGNISDLIPCEKAEVLDIASALFTDYAEKQRLIILPKGQRMKARGNGLPDFPDGTIIAKTFFYQNIENQRTYRKHILETRLLIKHQGQWNASTYKWNDAQDEAYLLKHGATVRVSFIDEKGNSGKTNYKIPSRADCISCHRQNDQILPIGLQLRNINIVISRQQHYVNQLEYLQQKGKLDISNTNQIATTIDYSNEAEPLEKRARAYLDINCAHCHQPSGTGYITQLDLRNETPINLTAIWLKQGKIIYRMTTPGDLHMPKIGTTIQHDAGVKLILDYISKLK